MATEARKYPALAERLGDEGFKQLEDLMRDVARQEIQRAIDKFLRDAESGSGLRWPLGV